MNIQRTILLRYLQDSNAEGIIGLDPKKFTGEHLRVLNFLRDFIPDNSGALPTSRILKRHYPEFAKDLRRKIKEPIRYLLEELDNAHAHNSIVDLVNQVTKQMKSKEKVSPIEVLRQMEDSLMTVRADVTTERQKAQDVTTRMDKIRERLDERRKKGGIIGYHFPFHSLTKHLRGARKKRLITLIARTSVGKTVFSFLVAIHMWQTYNMPVLFLSGEMDYDQLEDMYLSFIGKVSINKIENGDLSDKEMEELEKALEEARKNKAPFVFGYAGTFADVVTEMNMHNPNMLFVDSFYELDRFNESDDTKRTSINISRLQRMSREYDIPVFVNSQANRATDKKKGADLSNISFTDTIGQASDVVIGLNQPDEMRMAKEMEVQLLKNRGGRLARILLNWDFDNHDFSEIREVDEYGSASTPEESIEDGQDKVDKFSKLLGRDKTTKKSGKKLIKKKTKSGVKDKPKTKKKKILKKVA